MAYKEKAAQQSLINESQQKAVRTFIMGLNSPFMRTTLYGNTPKSLAEAFTIAQTIFYDNQHSRVKKCKEILIKYDCGASYLCITP